MIVFDLKCPHNHQFEAWFRSSAAYEDQAGAHMIACPECGATDISKAPMAPNVAAKGNQRPDPAPRPVTPATLPAARPVGTAVETNANVSTEVKAFLEKLNRHVTDNCDYVGNQFAEEARKIHYGEADDRGIYGESTAEETQDLLEEGIDILPLPGLRRADA